MNTGVSIKKGESCEIKVSFSYNPDFVQKIKTVKGHKWHPEEKYWTFPNINGTLKKILKVFEGENIYKDSALQAKRIPSPLVGEKHTIIPSPLAGEDKGEGDVESLRRELLSRKYSHKTVKCYLYYNKDLQNFTKKHPSEIDDGDIKNYLLHLVEEKSAATSTLNQAINALKFYYGSMLKKKFIYDIKRPRRERMLIHVKGANRYSILSIKALSVLREYWRRLKPKTWLFEGARAGQYVTIRTVQKILEHACQKAEIKKEITVHSLRHSFATHCIGKRNRFKIYPRTVGARAQ